MKSRARLLSHPIHQILIVFPLGLLMTSVVFDLIRIGTGDATWSLVASYMIGAGIIGGVLAAVFGMIDFLAIPVGTRARRIGAFHAVASATVLLLFGAGEVLRMGRIGDPSTAAVLLSLCGAAVAGASGWLGGELVTRMGIGVDDDFGLDAPSSISLAAAPSTRVNEMSRGAAETRHGTASRESRATR